MAQTMSFLLAILTSTFFHTSSTFSIPRAIPRGRRQYHPSSPSRFSSRLLSDPQNGEECSVLIPETNPNSNPNATSLSGVPYSLVISAIDDLYPPHELSSRNAKSRTDGYWKYIERGDNPPQELTYGEFDIEFFGMLLDRTWQHYLDGVASADYDMESDETLHPWRKKTFCDIGSGAGRLVLTASALHPEWKMCRGLEILQGLHSMSTSIVSGCRLDENEKKTTNDSTHVLRIPTNKSYGATNCTSPEIHAEYLPLAPLKFTCGSFTDPYEYLGDIDCAFVFSSCMKPDLVKELSCSIGLQCKPGTIIITTEFPLFLHGSIDPLEEDDSMPHGRYEIQLLEKIDGWCWLMGGESTAYIHRVKTSFWEEYAGPKEVPRLSLEEEAFMLVQSMENETLTDTKSFLRRVRNDMVFHGVPHEFIPEVDEGNK
mmetsp:Transcript_38604/g.92970  ORF Transcript_38604/g.92970 Transcript_38604/m.92970 type:complete len:428 (-) Transcript_38604:307-1590(-)